ncbi:hypothetical protein PI124_g1261 [Phytophthora idaei]|nr:hypothetical protein PI125_g9534 [Phytophthora idaei]KAG3173548.1 hypothetical protein PI126_g777 [Phytophthora idaei]KAG3254186.1 hypothetical protein PI124_g1261 [Phytophthora idaei]
MGQAESIEHQRQAGSHLVVGILNELGVDTDTNGAVVAAASDGISRLVSSATGSRPILTPSAVPPSDGGERVGSVDDASGMPALESPVCDGKEISEPMTTSVINEPAVNTDLVVATSAVNGILELIGLLREGDHVRKEKAAEALWGLSASDENKATIVAADGIPLLVALVRDGNAREKENALRTLWKLAFASTTNQDRIAAEGAVDLLEHITSKSQPPRLLVLAAGVLGLLGQHLDSRVRDHIAAYGGTQALLGFLQSHPNDSHTCEALTALLGVCVGGSFVVRSNVRIAGGESILMTVSRSDNKQITELVNRLLEWLTGNVAQLSALCTTMGEVEPLCRHILERLNSALNQGEDNEKIRCVRNRFSTVLKVNGGKAMVERLVSFRSVTGFLDEIHVELDQFECRGGLWRTSSFLTFAIVGTPKLEPLRC